MECNFIVELIAQVIGCLMAVCLAVIPMKWMVDRELEKAAKDFERESKKLFLRYGFREK